MTYDHVKFRTMRKLHVDLYNNNKSKNNNKCLYSAENMQKRASYKENVIAMPMF